MRWLELEFDGKSERGLLGSGFHSDTFHCKTLSLCLSMQVGCDISTEMSEIVTHSNKEV